MIIRGDARQIPIIDSCVQCVVTSPPYWGLRDYGIAGQIGLEANPAAYVAEIVKVFADVWRVLRDDGTVWLNLGDSYATQHSGDDLKQKDLCGIPWRVAFALQTAGWYLRSDIIWAKTNSMPESVTDRPTKAHEYLFLLTKSAQYFYNAEAIREPHAETERVQSEKRRLQRMGRDVATAGTLGQSSKGIDSGTVTPTHTMRTNPNGRNKRSVWTVATEPYQGAHFATFPKALVEPCVLAGSRIGDLVLDPFFGSGTVGHVAEALGRKWVGVDLTYQELSSQRTAQRSLLSSFSEAFKDC